MVIKASTSLRNEYNVIAALCKEKGVPVYLTKNGEGDLVVMSIQAFEKRERLLELREKLLESEALRRSGAKTHSLEETEKRLRGKLNGTVQG